MMIDNSKRSMAKAFTWRISAFILLSTISFMATDSIVKASIITLIYHSIQLVAFFFHERLWTTVNWGRTSGVLIQMTGLSGSGKSTIAKAVQKRLRSKGMRVEVIDGDEYREGLCKDLGFSKEDRNTNIRRLGFLGKVLARNDVVAILSAINPYEDVRAEIRKGYENTKTIYVDCGIEKLKDRDTKGLYKKALLPDNHPDKIKNFTGISDPFDAPLVCDLKIDTESESIEESTNKLEKFILNNV